MKSAAALKGFKDSFIHPGTITDENGPVKSSTFVGNGGINVSANCCPYSLRQIKEIVEEVRLIFQFL